MANLIPGKQLSGVLKPDVAVPWTVPQNAGNQRLTNLGQPTTGTDAARLQDIFNLPEKQVARAGTTANITLSGTQTIDGVAVVAGDRVLVKDQTLSVDNGIYDASAGAWTRSADADSGPELVGAKITVVSGTLNADTSWQQTAPSPITIGTTPIIWVEVGGPGAVSNPTTANKNMTASVTLADFDLACATPLAATASGHSFVGVQINGVGASLGNGDRTHACYFSGDGGATARSFATLQAGDLLYWVGTVALYQLAATDRVDFFYNI